MYLYNFLQKEKKLKNPPAEANSPDLKYMGPVYSTTTTIAVVTEKRQSEQIFRTIRIKGLISGTD